jgi:hypothetical protein
MGVGVVDTAHGDGDANCTRCATAWSRVGQYSVGDRCGHSERRKRSMQDAARVCRRERMSGDESPEWSRGSRMRRSSEEATEGEEEPV